MQEVKLKPLSMGKCIEDLKPQFDIPVGKNVKLLCKIEPKLLRKAEEFRLLGDEENSYIFYMKYLSVLQYIKSFKDTDENSALFMRLYNKNKMVDALDHAERLAESLQKRYKELEENSALEKERREYEQYKETLRRQQIEAEKEPELSGALYNGLPESTEVSISCTGLYNLLKQQTRKILILDARPASSFNESRIKFPDCVISVPEEIVKAGVSAAALERSLPIQSKELWSKRGLADLVVLLDWSTTTNALTPGSNLYILKNILLKWDPGNIYEATPLILEGGYEEWLLRYPAFTTNPLAKPPMQKKIPIEDLLNNIEYPNLMEQNLSSSLAPVSVPVPTVNRSVKPAPVVSSTSLPTVAAVRSRPSVDRQAKVAAVQTYVERALAVRKLLELADTSLELERTRLKAEEEWERLRVNKEREAEEEMKLQLQEREEQLMSNIQKLEKLQIEKEIENQTLRDELDEYKKKEQEQNLPKDDASQNSQEEEINAEIRSKEEEKQKIASKREEKLKERERRVAEDKNGKLDWKQLEREQKEREKTTVDYHEREKVARDRLMQERLAGERLEAEHLARRIAKEQEEREQQEQCRMLDKEKDTYIAPLKDVPSGSSSMKRSHSSPNIAQLEDEDVNIRHKVPQFDRAIKPLQRPRPSEIRDARQRNFNPVYGCMGRGLTGLKNLGNTCYMNSIIQCLNNTTPLAVYFCGGEYREDVNRHNETRGEVADEVAAVVRALWSGQYRSIAILDLRNIVGQHRDQFQTNQQQDSNEFLTILMDWLHEDLKKVESTSKRELIREREQSEWDRQWQQFYRENSSLVVSLFYGQQKSTVRCLSCGEESVRFETFSNLTLPLPSNMNRCTLEDCVQLYLRGERITGWKCPSCKEPRDATKKFDIIKLPPILIIHFKRFYMEGWCRKKQTFVDFPLFNMDMKKHSLLRDQRYTNYNLYGVSNHYGTMEGGHYTAYCKSHVYRKWYKFDDQEVSELLPSDVRSGAAYILFYASVDYSVPDVS